jgi:hypothetical protein
LNTAMSRPTPLRAPTMASLTSLIAVPLCLALTSTPVLARPSVRTATVVPSASATGGEVSRLSVLAERIQTNTPPPQRVGSRDSLRNGAIIGAVIGAVAFGAIAATLCHAYQEDGGPSCVPDTLRFAAIGGAVGTGAGLAVDAARSNRRVTVRLTIRF